MRLVVGLAIVVAAAAGCNGEPAGCDKNLAYYAYTIPAGQPCVLTLGSLDGSLSVSIDPLACNPPPSDGQVHEVPCSSTSASSNLRCVRGCDGTLTVWVRQGVLISGTTSASLSCGGSAITSAPASVGDECPH
jgi:hypothetical protein